MNSGFDLNLNNYSKEELVDIFELPKNYTNVMLEDKYQKMKQNIMLDNSVPSEVKMTTINFLQKALEVLKNTLATNIKGSIQHFENTYKSIYNLDKSLKKSDVTNEGSTYLIKRPEVPYGKSMPSEFYEGTINPLDKRILRQNLNIDTRFRNNYYSTSATNIHFDLPITLTNIVSMQLTAIEFPTTYYVVSNLTGNNYFGIDINGEQKVVTVPNGNYTAQGMVDYLNNYVKNVVDGSFNSILFTLDNSSYNGSGKTIVGIKSPSTPFNFTLNFQIDKDGNPDTITPLPLKFGWLLGFREGVYVNNSTYVSEGMVDLLGPKYIYLVVDDYNNSVNDGFYGAFNSSILNKNILARISLQGLPFSSLMQNNLSLITYPRQYFGPVTVQKLQVQLLDEYGRILDLNNNDYSFCLTFQTLYDL